MLRLPKLKLATPSTLEEAVAFLREHGEQAMILAGGTDLLPNMKHELFNPKHLLSLGAIPELAGIRREPDGTLVIGAMTTLDLVAQDELVASRAPALSQAVQMISGPQLRRMGTLGGNVMLDTRCQWYNQTYFWREALGFCLKKDGTECHVVKGGQKCVAAASNDSAPALMSLDARLIFVGPKGRREIPIDELWLSDGIYNKKSQNEILVEIRIPKTGAGHRGAYGKLRDRGSIDFPLFGVAVRLELAVDGETISDAALCTVALQAKPGRLKQASNLLKGQRLGTPEFEAALEATALRAHKSNHPLPNIPGDSDYRHAMVPVYVKRTLRAALAQNGPVHHI